MMVWRMSFTPDMTFLQMAWPTLLTGPAMVMFFVPVTGLAMASVGPSEQANAAGLSNFMRTLAGAFATSIVQTGWSNATRTNQTELSGVLRLGQASLDGMHTLPGPAETVRALLSTLVESQSVMLATLNVFGVVAICLLFAATLIWVAPKPKGPIDTSAPTEASHQAGLSGQLLNGQWRLPWD